jgi:CMP-N-acetylneuraminic acid synthetase
MKPYILGAIFARGGSKGVPRKNVRLLAGKPLITYAIEAARGSRYIDRVIVSTDDAEIAQTAQQAGAEVPFMRPAELARDDSPEWLAWRHALITLMNESPSRPIDILASVPTTSPLRTTSDIDACIEMLLNSDADVTITTRLAERNPYFNMVVLDEDHNARLVITPDGSIQRRQDAPLVYDMTTVAYAARTEFVLNKESIFAGKVKAVVVPAERSIDIDTELDFAIAELLLRRTQR